MKQIVNNFRMYDITNVFYQIVPSVYDGYGNSRAFDALGFRNHRRTDKQTLEPLGSGESSGLFFHLGVKN